MFNREQASGAFDSRCRKVELSASALTFTLSLAYLSLLFPVGLRERLSLVGCLAASCVIAVLIAGVIRRGRTASIRYHLEDEAKGDSGDKTAAAASNALTALVSLPLGMQRAAFFSFGTAILVVPALMWAMGFEGWIGASRLRSLASISFVASAISGAMLFYWSKQSFAGLRADVAGLAVTGDSDDGAIVENPLQRRILMAIMIPTLACVLLVADVVSEKSRSSRETDAAQWALLAVESVSSGDGELPLAERLSDALPASELWPTPIEIVDIRANQLAGLSVEQSSAMFLNALDEALASGGSAGFLIPTRGSVIGAYRQLGAGRVLVAIVQRSALGNQGAVLLGIVGLICLGVVLFALVIGRLVAAEMTGGIAALAAAADRLAAGDLTPSAGIARDDEFGAASCALAAVGQQLRSTVEHMSATAEAANRTAEEVSLALVALENSGAEHTEQIQQANRAVGAIANRVTETSEFAQALSATIDESGDSLLELGATGDELNETASALTSKVTEVSDSLEQMVQGVRQVAGISERMTLASEETSSSMEEMASAMRAVDTSAETTANLSSDVVSKAEVGQAKVVQTIEGMEAIREATDVAEKVIRGLGARTNEIGGILDVIDDVADETNLLALNAAIIAAQAGEHGKAFSVVADEIKELADRVLASTKEIGALIRAVQDESENAIGAIEAGSESVMSGVDLSAEAGRTLEEITVTSRESGLRISEIVVSVREQTKAASHVVGLMEKVRESAEEIELAGRQQDAGNEVIYQSAVAMREVAQQVCHATEEQTVGFGRIRENVSGVREAIEKITHSLGEQVGDCRQAEESLGRVSSESHANEGIAKKIQEAVRDLVQQAEVLREDAERFRV